MRVLALALSALLLLPAPAAAQREFIRDYKDGVELFKKGNNDALAEQKFKEARDHPRAPKKQGQKVNLSGNFFEPFIPDYYLGIIAARNGRHREAQELLDRAIRDELVTPSQRADYALAQRSLEQSRQRLAANTRPAPPVEPVRPPPANTTTTPATPTTNTATNATPAPNTTVTPPPQARQPATTVTPPPVRPPAEPTWLASFRKSMDASRAALKQGHYTEARGNLAAAAGAAGDAASRQQADALRREIDQALAQETVRVEGRARAAIARKDVSTAMNEVATLQTLAPAHGALADLRGGIDRLRAAEQGQARLATVERLGVKLFLSGNYNESAKQLKQAVDAGMASPRIYLYLASSRAAEALLAPPNERDALVAEARSTYARARQGTSAADEKFISPSILGLLKNGG